MASPVSQLRSVLQATKCSQMFCPKPQCSVIGSNNTEYLAAVGRDFLSIPTFPDLLLRTTYVIPIWRSPARYLALSGRRRKPLAYHMQMVDHGPGDFPSELSTGRTLICTLSATAGRADRSCSSKIALADWVLRGRGKSGLY